MCKSKYIMNVYVGSDQAKLMTASEVLWFHECGVNFVVEGDELPAEIQVDDFAAEQVLYTEESMGQDDEGNEIYVMRRLGADDPA